MEPEEEESQTLNRDSNQPAAHKLEVFLTFKWRHLLV